MKKRNISKFLISLLVIFFILQISLNNVYTVFAIETDSQELIEKREENQYVYISDLDYILTNNWSYTEHGQIIKDKNIAGNKIGLLLEGSGVEFDKGITAHATSQLTFDISKYSSLYTRFVANIGIDKSQNGKGNVWFEISASNDGNNWQELYKSEPITSGQNAYQIDLNVSGYKYLRLYADKNGGNGNDHAVYADARLVKTDYDLSADLYQGFQKLSYYDEILAKNDLEYNYENNMDLVLKREFVNRIGYWAIQNGAKNSKIKDALDWLISDKDALKLTIESGEVKDPNNYLKNLGMLYENYKDIMGNENDSYIYKKMLIALSVAYGSDIIASPLKFNSSSNSYDIVERYEVVKKLYDDELFARKEEFKTYNMELIRFIMNDSIANNEAIWLNGYSRDKFQDDISKRLNPYSYMAYISPNYNRDEFFDINNKEKYDTKYELSKYNVPFGDGRIQRIWMAMEAGGICWNISRLGQNLYKVYGIPVVGVYQPGHEAYIYYSEDSNGNGIWNIGNNVSGWGHSYTSWYGGNIYRLLLGWGNKSYCKSQKNNAGYILLAQGALNDSENYYKSFYYNLIANSYDNEEKEKIYNKALEIQNINLNTYENLIDLYEETNKSSAEWKELALKVTNAYTYYPVAMVDLIDLIMPHLNKDDTVTVDMVKTKALNIATKATTGNSLQPNACKEIAQSMLGDSAVELADFSFDGGENAGTIVINSKYEDYEFQIQYSIDGGKTWQTSLEHKIKLSEDEINKINPTDDIIVRISGSNEIYTIDILEGEIITTNNLTKNDDENTLVGKINNLQYSIDDGVTWNDYDSNITFPGEQIVKVRYKANGKHILGNVDQFTFTTDTPENNKYIPVKYISFVSAGTEQSGQPAIDMIDGNPFTTWHTKFGEVAQDKSYVVSFDKERYLTQITYDPAGVNGRIRDVQVYISTDGKNWTLAGEAKNWANDTSRKTLILNEVSYAKYVKILATYTYGNSEGPNKYVSGKAFNYYEDITKISILKGDINGDGILDILDLSILNKHLIEISELQDEFAKIAADINNDKMIDILDLSLLNKEILK